MADTQDPKKLFGETPIPRLFITAALPGAIGMLASSIYGAVDGILVGNLAGETPFAAVNLAMPFVIVLFAFGDLIGVGSAVPISIALGENRDDDANNIFSCSCIVNVLTGVFLGLLLWLLAPTIFALMGATGELAAMATTYLRVWAFFAPVTTICYSFDNYLRISGLIQRSLFANIFMAVFGGVLEFILLGPCGMGVGAAAFAFSMGMIAAVIISAWPFLKGGLQLTFVRPRFHLSEVIEVFRCGLSTFLGNAAGRITSIVMNAALLRLGGEEAVSIYGVAMFADELIIPLIYGTLDALQPAVGYNWGARDYGRVRDIELWCYGSVAVMSLVLVGCMEAFPELVIHLFIPDAEGAFLAEAIFAVRIILLAYLLRWFVFGTDAFLVNVGEVIPSTALSICGAVAFPLPLIWLLMPMGLTGLWFVNVISTSLCAVLSVVLLLRLRAKIAWMNEG